MPRSTKVFKKRTSVGKPLCNSNDSSLSNDLHSSKLDSSFLQYDEFKENKDSGNEIISLDLLQNALNKISVCKTCHGNLSISVKKRIGLASELHITCVNCDDNVAFFNSKMSTNDKSMYDVNLRVVYALRSIGKGQVPGKLFCGIMNLPPPPTKFGPYVDVLSSASEIICKEEMKKAAEESININDGNTDLCVAFDGTWQKRGHLSLNGVVTATSVDTGKVIDVSVMSKFCKCPRKNCNEHTTTCIANYHGASGGMEVAGVAEIFNRSVSLYNAEYVKYLGDGDSKAYKAVVSSNIYGNKSIEKLECIGHIQKRMGCRLNELKKKFAGKKLSDGKPLGGKNRLTDALILKIQKYYGLAIRRNTGSLQNMQKDVWAEYFHLLSTNESPNHGLCPVGKESWCKFQRASTNGEIYDHKAHTHVPVPIMEVLKPIFRDLANPELLKKCLHGKTQNPNESVNNVIWTRLPKTVFVSLKTLKFGVHDAVSCFNSGNITRCSTLSNAGIDCGMNCVKMMQQLDKERLIDVERKLSDYNKTARQKNKLAKRKLENAFEEEEIDNPPYKSGFY